MNRSDNIKHLLRTCDVALYGYRGECQFPVKTSGIVRVYVKDDPAITHKLYQTYRDIYESKAEAVFLDGEAIRNLLIGFPVHSATVLVAMRWSHHWLFGLPGLLRRLLQRHVTIRGWYKDPACTGQTRWLVLENHLPTITKNNTIAAPNNVDDIEKLITYLNAESIQYVILRNYEYLPELHREHGDVDFLVEDTDVDKVRGYILDNPGHQSIGIHTVAIPSSKVESVPYLPPKKARELIKERIPGRCNSWIPKPESAFQSYAYHCVYNKGVASGVPSEHADIPINAVLDNDYIKNLKRLANAAGITDIEFTMEGLDRYLEATGWRPHSDTLLKLAEKNIWIKKHFFSKIDCDQDASFVVMILRKHDLSDQCRQDIFSMIESYGFKVIFNEPLAGKKKTIAEESLRGGVWIGRNERSSKEYLPSDFMVITDLYTLNKSKVLFAYRVRLLKQRIRQQISRLEHGSNILHSTDNTTEAIEYIKTVFPECLDRIVKDVEDLSLQNVRSNVGLRDKIALYRYYVYDTLQMLKAELRIKVVNFIFG